jgi:predicted dehydrogenase
MSIASALGFGGKKVRYGIVGLGNISQQALMPAVRHTGNSEITAFVSGNPERMQELGKDYGVENLYAYERFGELIRSGQVDALYIGTPNWRHEEFVVPALEAGIHVLCEKPLEVSVEKSRRILEVAQRSSAKLMVAYRLHFEPATLDAIERIRKGELGQIISFTSLFSQAIDRENHRAKHGVEAGPLFDMGPYPINAIRYLFGEEPVEVASAVATRQADSGMDLDDTWAVVLRMPGDRLASFTVSYIANSVDSYIIAGTEGSIHMSPAYGFESGLEQNRTIGETKKREAFSKTDHFGGELKYFSDCVLENREPEPNGEEGLADMLVLDAIVRAKETGQPQRIEPFSRSRRIDPAQVQKLRPVSIPEDVDAPPPTGE